MQCEEDWLVMHALYAHHGWSISMIAREFGVNWRTANRYATAEDVPRYRQRERPAELTEAQAAHLERRLDRCSDLRATTLYRELQELGYEGCYPSLVRRVRAIRPRDEDTDPVVRFETDPGIQAQVDWTDCGAWLVGDALRKLHAFVAVLGYSRMVAVHFATDTTRPTTLRLLVAALEDLGGAPVEVLSDPDPALVIGETPAHRPVFAPEWSDLAATLGTKPRACRAHRAQTKGKVERAIREVKEDFLRWLTSQVLPSRPSLADYDRLARRWRWGSWPPAGTAPPAGWSARRGSRSDRCCVRSPHGSSRGLPANGPRSPHRWLNCQPCAPPATSWKTARSPTTRR